MGSEWILVILGLLSITVVAIGLQRFTELKKIAAKSCKFWDSFGDAWIHGRTDKSWKDQAIEDTKKASLEQEVLAMVEANKSLETETIQRKVAAFLEHRRLKLEKNVSVLGTIGANAAFIGLLGTVLGIVRAFNQISAGGVQSGIENISSGIAEALVATAVGLIVAIPAVVLFNYFNRLIANLVKKAGVAGEVAVTELKKK